MRLAKISAPYKLIDPTGNTYWSGEDVSLYAENVFLDNITTLQLSVSEAVQPYYGYSSFTPNRFHHGARLITGSFSINFRTYGWIFAALENAFIRPQDGRTASEEFKPVGNGITKPTAVSGAGIEQTSASQLSILAQREKEKRAINNDLPERKFQISKDKSLFGTFPKMNFKVLFGLNTSYTHNVAMGDGGEWVFGSVAPNANPFKPGTGIELVDVHITGFSQQMSDSGQPVMENYAFMAADIK
jgi:hypothetical protein